MNVILSFSKKYENLREVFHFFITFYAENIHFKFSFCHLIFKLRDSISLNVYSIKAILSKKNIRYITVFFLNLMIFNIQNIALTR